MNNWKILSSEIIEKNEWLTVRKDSCETTNGKKVDDYYVVEIPDVCCTVALTKEQIIILVKEYKHGVQQEIMQLPCGYIGKGESPLKAAQRELLEETGYATTQWTPLGRFAGSPGKLNHYYHFFLAENVEKVQEPQLDPIESVQVFSGTLDEAEKRIYNDSMDVITPLGFFLAQKLLLEKNIMKDSH